MGGAFWKGCSYFGTDLSVGLDPLLLHFFSFYFLDFFVVSGKAGVSNLSI